MVGENGIAVEDVQEWSGICKRAFTSSRETKMQSLQFKIYNRIVPCGVHLKQIRIKDTDCCPFCQEKDTIIHFFFHCRVVSTFWRQICGWFANSVDLYLEKLSPKEFLFGVPDSYHKHRIINLVLIQLRFFIFRQKLFHSGKLCLIQWLQEFKLKLQVEKWVCSISGKQKSFTPLENILRALG